MNENNTSAYNSYPAPKQGDNKSKTALIVGLVVVIVLLAALGGYTALASVNKWWPFSATTAETSEKAEPSLSIKNARVATRNGKSMLDVIPKLNTEEKGYCVLTLSSKITRLEIDDSKAQPKASTSLKQCQGWSLDTSTLPQGDYKIDVKFVGKDSTLTASDKVTLENTKFSN